MKAREIKARINSVSDTVKITKAMQMISTSKLQKSQRMFSTSKKYLDEVTLALNMLMTKKVKDHPYFVPLKPDGKAAYFVIADDKGFCGDYNNLVLESAYKSMQNKIVSSVFAVGHMAWDYFKKKNIEVFNAYTHLIQDPMPEDARAVTDDLIERFLDKETDEVYLIYTEPQNLSHHEIIQKRLLPIEYEEKTEQIPLLSDEESVTEILKQYIWAEIYYAIASASLSVNYKRMVAMQQSSTNGEEILDELVLDYNHKRQERITTELVDSSFNLLKSYD